MTLDLNHDGVKDYIKRNNLELKKIESKDSLIHNLLRIGDLRIIYPLVPFGPWTNQPSVFAYGPSIDAIACNLQRFVDPCSE